MSKPQLNQSKLYEILVQEVESLKNTSKEHSRLQAQIEAHLQRLESLYKQPIPVDVSAMQVAHAHLSKTLASGLYVPKWLGLSWFVLLVSLSLSALFNYKQYTTNKSQRTYIEHAEAYIEELETNYKKRK